MAYSSSMNATVSPTENPPAKEVLDLNALRQFITACHDLDAYVRDIMIPSPD